jgi:hypothetical protein
LVCGFFPRRLWSPPSRRRWGVGGWGRPPRRLCWRLDRRRGVRPLERLGRSGGRWLLKGSGISYKLPLIHGAASHHLKRNCLPALTLRLYF